MNNLPRKVRLFGLFVFKALPTGEGWVGLTVVKAKSLPQNASGSAANSYIV